MQKSPSALLGNIWESEIPVRCCCWLSKCSVSYASSLTLGARLVAHIYLHSTKNAGFLDNQNHITAFRTPCYFLLRPRSLNRKPTVANLCELWMEIYVTTIWLKHTEPAPVKVGEGVYHRISLGTQTLLQVIGAEPFKSTHWNTGHKCVLKIPNSLKNHKKTATV